MLRSKLKSVISDETSEEQEEEEEEEEDEYEVEKIINVRINPKTKKKEYLVKWENYSGDSNTWEPEVNLRNVRDIIEEFEASQKQKTVVTIVQPSSHQYHQQEKKITVASDQRISETTMRKSKKDTADLLQSSSLSLDVKNSSSSSRSKNNPAAAKHSVSFIDDLETNESTTDELIAAHRTSASSRGKKDPQSSKKKSSVIEASKSSHQKMNNTEEIPAASSASTKISDLHFSEKDMQDNDEALEISLTQLQQDQEQEFIFEEIKDKRTLLGRVEYLVQFSGLKQAQWVQEEDLEDFSEELTQFNGKIKQDQVEIIDSKDVIQETAEVSRQLEVKETAKAILINCEEGQQQQQSKSKGKSNNHEGKKETKSRSEVKEITDKKQDKKPLEKSSERVHSLDVQKNILSTNTTNQELQHKRQTTKRRSDIHRLDDEEEGDFKTDFVEQLNVLGCKPHEIMSSRIEVMWKTRDDGTKPSSTIYSASYIRRHEPDVLIDYMMSSLMCLEDVSKSLHLLKSL